MFIRFSLTVILSAFAFAYPVSESMVNQVSNYFLIVEKQNKDFSIDKIITLENDQGQGVGYLVFMKPHGFILHPIETDIAPNLSYSFRNTDLENSNQLQFFIEYLDNINNMKFLFTTEEKMLNDELWTLYINNDPSLLNREVFYWPEQGITPTGGWVETEWGQGSSFNALCPNCPIHGLRSKTGCVATAQSQILNYFMHIGLSDLTPDDQYDSPLTCTAGEFIDIDGDSESLDFPDFPEMNTYLDQIRTIFSTGNHVESNLHIAALNFQSGILNHMGYGHTYSGTIGGYSDSYIEDYEYTYAEDLASVQAYEKMIVNMKNGQPGTLVKNLGGIPHSWVVDGYKSDGYVHLNMGWGFGGDNLSWLNLSSIPYISTFSIATLNITPPNTTGTIQGNVFINGGSGNVEDVQLSIGSFETNPDNLGDYLFEVFNGTYDLRASLYGYSDVVIEDVQVSAGEIVNNLNIDLIGYTPQTITVNVAGGADYTDINEAIENANNSDLIIVAPGTYIISWGDDPINFLGKEITVSSEYYYNENLYYIDNTIIQQTFSEPVATFGLGETQHAVLSGFTLESTFDSGDPPITHNVLPLIYCSNSSPTLKNLVLVGHGGKEVGGAFFEYSNSILENIIVTDHYSDGPPASGILVRYSDLLISSCIISDNQEAAGLFAINSDITLLNSTIMNNETYGVNVSGGNLTCINTLFWGNIHQNLDVDDEFDNLVEYCLIDEEHPGTGNIHSDPLIQTQEEFKYRLSYLSPCMDAGDPDIDDDGLTWQIDPDDQDQDGTRADIGFYHIPQLDGIISVDRTFDSGHTIVNGNLTIAPGAVLTIAQNNSVFVADDAELIIEGSIVADALSPLPILLSSISQSTNLDWKGIKLSNGGDIYLRNVSIGYAAKGVHLPNSLSSIDISDCTFTENYCGVYVTSNDHQYVKNCIFIENRFGIYSKYSDTFIHNNLFEDNVYGMYAYYSDCDIRENDFINNVNRNITMSRSNPVISRNEISGAPYGIYCTNYSGPDLTTHRDQGENDVNNYIHDNNLYGVYVSSYSTPDLGVWSVEGKYPPFILGGFNYFTDNDDYDIYNSTPSTIFAQVNWWENDTPDYHGLVATGYQANDVLGMGPGSLPKGSSLENLLVYYQQARLLEKDSLYIDAVALYDSIIINDIGDESNFLSTAMIGIERCYRSMDSEVAFVEKMDVFRSEYPNQLISTIANYMAAGALARISEFEAAIGRFETSVEEYGEFTCMDEQEAWALFDIGQVSEILEESGSGLGKASKVNNQLLTDYPDSEAAEMLRELLGKNNIPDPTALLPTKFKLNHPYPNPFNPSTTIQYELPKTADVTITIYDILGRNVWSYEESAKPAGYYSLQWNGVNNNGKLAASGIYLISFSTPEFRAVQKAVLIR